MSISILTYHNLCWSFYKLVGFSFYKQKNLSHTFYKPTKFKKMQNQRASWTFFVKTGTIFCLMKLGVSF